MISALFTGIANILSSYLYLRDAAPSEAPPGLQVQAVSSTSLTLNWGELPIDKQNGIIRRYEVAISLGDGVVRNADVPKSKHSITVQNLKAHTTYWCRVRAHTISPGPYSVAVQVTTEEDSKYKTIHVFMAKLYELATNVLMVS